MSPFPYPFISGRPLPLSLRIFPGWVPASIFSSSDCEESIFDRKKREKKEEQDSLREKFAENGLDLSEIDRAETVDQYQNMAGGGIIPGVQLSALMEDD